MGWTDVDLSGVNPNFELVPEGEYDYQIMPGAKVDDYGRLSIQLSIATPGDNSGRRVFLQFPDPSSEKGGWVPKALKRLEQSVGIEQDKEAGETVVALAQRWGENFAKFHAPLTHRSYQNNAGETVTKEDVKVFKSTPAA